MQSVTELSCGAKKAFTRGKLVIDDDVAEIRKGFEYISSNMIKYRTDQLEEKNATTLVNIGTNSAVAHDGKCSGSRN